MKRTKGFDGLRCLSVLFVIIGHAQLISLPPELPYLKNNVAFLFSDGAGVNIFFTLSGFLITSLLLHEKSSTGHINIKYFFIRRFLRLRPPIIPFFIAIAAFMSLGYIRETYLGLAASVVYLYNFIPKAKLFYSAELSHTWSLAVEEQFYLTWPFIIKFFSNTTKYLLTAAVVLLCAMGFYLFPAATITINGARHPLAQVFFVAKWTLPAIGPIIIGCVAALIYLNHHRAITELFAHRRAGLVALAVLLSPLYFVGALIPAIPLAFSAGLALVLLWITTHQESWVVRALEFRPIRYIGLISYGLYIWQGFFVRSGQGALPKIWLHNLPYNIPLTFITAIISYELLEKKMMRYKDHFRPSGIALNGRHEPLHPAGNVKEELPTKLQKAW
jgi:peptidoglycan/LPS O-acetylase OafA/YrhL